MTAEQIHNRVEAVEESYEFFLAYAAQGISGDGSDGEAVRTLSKMNEALDGLADGYAKLVSGGEVKNPDAYGGMIEVLRRDADNTRAALRVVMAQSPVSSQLVDNFNASIHVRALLTDLFLLDEALS